MSRDLDIIIESLQKIMLTPEQIRAALAKQPPRGALAAVYREIGGTEEEQYTSCCADAEEAKEVDPEEVNPWTGKDGNAPDEYTTTPEGVTDCETGQPVNMTFTGGFTQAESCKECGPDPSWEEGRYWGVGLPSAGAGATKEAACAAAGGVGIAQNVGTGVDVCVISFRESCGTSTPDVIYKGQARCTRNKQFFYFMECGTSIADYCQLTEAPEICGDDWDTDGLTQLTLRNGCIVGSKCDPDAVASDLGCNDCRDLCKDGVKWRFCATSDGGWVQYDPDGIRTGGKYKDGKKTAPIPPGAESDYL